MQGDRIVLCMKWGTLYPADYVNVLYRAVCDNLQKPFRFVCLTDDATGFDEGIEHFPIPDMGLQECHWKHGCWAKLSLFSADLYGLKGRALFIDLDTVICGPLDDMFDHPAPFVGIDTGPNWKDGSQNNRAVLGTGVFAYTIGAHPDLLEKFNADRDRFVARDVLEQIYIEKEIGPIAYWPYDLVPSFKYHLRHRYSLDLLISPRPPGLEARMLAFHGDPRPIDLIRRKIWGVFPHLGRGPVKWFADYWKGYGGR